MNINIDGKNFEIKTLADFKRAGEEIKRVNDFKVGIAKNKYERTKNIYGAEQVLRKELNDLNEEYQAKLDELWKAKREVDLQNSKENNMNYYAKLAQEKKNSLSEKAKQLIYKAVAEARFDYRTAIDFAIADLKAEKEWAWTSQNEVSQMVQRLIKNRMDFGGFNSKDSKEEKDNSILSTEMYKGYRIEVYKAKAGVDYGFNIYDKSGSLFDWGTYFDSERDALRWAKLAVDRKSNSKDENEKGYYEEIIEQKNGFEEEYSKLMFKMKRMQGDPKTTWSQMEDLNKEFSELKKKYGKPHNYGMTNEKRNFGDEVLIEKKSFGEYWYSIYQNKDKMILRVYTPYGMYYIDDIRDLADGRNEAQRTIDIVKKAGRYV